MKISTRFTPEPERCDGGWTVIYLAAGFGRLVKNRYGFFATRAEAVAYIERVWT